MIEATPVLHDRIGDPRQRDSGNTTLMKDFPGGSLIIGGANSAKSLRNLSVKKLILDEIDAYEMDLEGEGDTCSLAIKRADAFGDAKKVMR
ncbi:MAG: phage terminase large subunit family protein [Desulfobacterales bacterium]|nr:phage terminase large subunit family protein [Desulfobacterales bacterium]